MKHQVNKLLVGRSDYENYHQFIAVNSFSVCKSIVDTATAALFTHSGIHYSGKFSNTSAMAFFPNALHNLFKAEYLQGKLDKKIIAIRLYCMLHMQ